MRDLHHAAAAAAEELGEALRRRGWDLDDDGTCWGDVHGPAGLVAMKVEFPGGFPFVPPRATPVDGSGCYSWHQNADGSLCLYSPEDSEDLPWLDAERFVARIEKWFANDADDWPDDPPDLDLERYFDPAEGFVVYDDVERLLGRPFRLRAHGARWEVELGGRPRRGASEVLLGFGADLGELERPIHNWDELAAVVGQAADDLEARARRGELHVLLACYSRKGHDAAIVLRVRAGRDRGRRPTLKAMPSAPKDPETLRLRSGPYADVLRERSVAIVGLGAVGSFLADLLARAGIGYLHLIDRDRLRPGNSIRHLLGSRYWGWNKAKAVADLLGDAHHVVFTTFEQSLVSIDDAVSMLVDHDLVVDASANGWTNELVASAAEAVDGNALTVYLQRAGGIVRIDRWPVRDGEEPRSAIPELSGGAELKLREAGCGDPVSPTPAWAVTAAASRAAATAIALLVGEPVAPTLVDVLVRQPDEPYTTIGVVL